MWSLQRSRMQHLGISGENNQHFGRLEHGLGFVPDSARQFEAIADTYDQLLANQPDYLEPRRGLRLLAWRVRTALRRQQD